jgi:acetylglutamate kinase
LIGNIEGNGTEKGLITIWLVVVHGGGGQLQQRIVRLGMNEEGFRSPNLERLSQELLHATRPLENFALKKVALQALINGKATELLHRELVYSGFLSEDSSYSSRLLACFWVEI